MAEAHTSAEARFLLLMAGGSHNDSAIATLAASGLDWKRVAMLAERENTFPVFLPRVTRLAGRHLPAEFVEPMRRRTMVAQFSLLHHMKMLESALSALNAAGVDVLLLKGAGLAAGVYGSFVARPMGDIDILVRPGDVLATRDALERAGWKQQGNPNLTDFYAGHQHLEPFFDIKGSGASLEVHVDILAPGHPFRLELDRWWKRRQPVSVGAQKGWAPSPAHQLLHVCIHFAWSNGLSSSAWNAFRDVAALVGEGRIDWNEFTEMVIAARAQTCAYWTLYLARALARVDVPDEVVARLQLQKSRWLRALVVRNFVVCFGGADAACPSTRVRRAIWLATVAPEASGHGDARPWVRDHLFAEPNSQRNRTGVSRFDAWRKYLAAVVRGTPAARLST